MIQDSSAEVLDAQMPRDGLSKGAQMLGRMTRRLDRLSDRRFAILISLPGLALFAISVVPPVFAVLGMSILRIELIRGDSGTFVGLRNYAHMASDSTLLDALPVTLVFAASTVILSLPLALASAVVLARRRAGGGLLAIAMLIPWAIAPVVTGVYWGFMFQGQFGIATAAANGLGLATGPVPWLQQTSSALAIAVLATVWRSVPLLTLILLAAIKRIPESVYRAAKADGASALETFRYVTLPLIRRYLVLAGVLQLIMALQVFDTIYTLTGGGPGRSTTVLIYYIFEAAFKQLSLGYSAAMAVALTVLIGLCSLPLVLTRIRRLSSGGAATAASPQTSRVDERVLTRREAGAIARITEMRSLGAGSAESARPRRAGTASLRALRRIAVATGVVLLVIWSVGPVVWIALASVQHEGAVTSVPLALSVPTLDNYTDLLFAERRGTFGSALPWLSGIWTSVQIAVLAAISTVLFGALIAFPLARLEFPLKGVLMVTLIATQMIPAIVLAIPVLFLFRALQLDDTIAGLAIVSAAFHMPVVVWMLRSAFMDVPKSYERAARMDGCSRLGTIFRISIPAARPAILATIILVLIGTWNEFLFAVVLGNTEAITVMRLIGTVEISSGPTGRAPYTLLAAAGFLAVLPVLALVATFQRRIVNGLTEVHVKG